MISTLKGFFELKKLLNGSQPKEIQALSGDKIYVTAQDGGGIAVNKGSGTVLSNCHIDQLVNNVTYNIVQTGNTDGFSFDTAKASESFNRDDLSRMSKPLPIPEQITRKVSTIRTDLLIKKPDILGHSAWSFKYNDRAIEAKILDDEFLDNISKGNFTITGGSFITADLEISIDLGTDGLPDEQTTKYTVLKVYGGIQDNVAKMQSLIDHNDSYRIK